MKFVFPQGLRNLPCSIARDEDLWCVSGEWCSPEGYGVGVLEWCYDRSDAEAQLRKLSKRGDFRNLRAHPWMKR